MSLTRTHSGLLRLGTRGSALARAQAALVHEALVGRHPALRVETVYIRTSGDRGEREARAPAGLKGLFVKEIEDALLAGEIDVGVHSMKDLPARLPAGLVVGAVPARAAAHDVLIGATGLRELPPGARVGTASVRRRAQLLARRPDLAVTPLRGNVDTRLRRWRGRGGARAGPRGGIARGRRARDPGRMSGRVYLVGAGPGDPGLLTRRGERCLAAADVVVHDRLVGSRLLDLVRPGAEVIALGRSHDDGDRPSQEAIEALLVERARAGKTVVRLKNGDPFLLGRGAEEAEALRRAEVPFEVVPGVSSAFAVPAYAGIPLTHRDHASLVTIATGHQARVGEEAVPPALPWAALAHQGGRLVFLMGMRQMPAIMAALIAHGLAADTPAAAIQSGTTGAQATVVATAGTLAARVRAAGLEAPGVVVVGSVVTL